MNLAENHPAGRALSASTGTGAETAVIFSPSAGTEPVHKRARPLAYRVPSTWAAPPVLEPSPDATAADWGNPWTRVHILNAIDDDEGQAFAFLNRRSLVLLKALIQHRNAKTGRCDPSWPRLGYVTGYSIRSVAYALAELEQVHGLILHQRRRRRGVQTSNAYWLAPRFFELAGLTDDVGAACKNSILQRAKTASRSVQPVQTNRDPTDPKSTNTGEGEPLLARSATDPSPVVVISHPPGSSEDPTWIAFEAIFQRERAAKYGNKLGGSMRAEHHAEVAEYLRSLTERGYAKANAQGRDVREGDVFEALTVGLVRAWLAHEGKGGFLATRQHPIGALFADLGSFGESALSEWSKPPRIARGEGLRMQLMPREIARLRAREEAGELSPEERAEAERLGVTFAPKAEPSHAAAKLSDCVTPQLGAAIPTPPAWSEEGTRLQELEPAEVSPVEPIVAELVAASSSEDILEADEIAEARAEFFDRVQRRASQEVAPLVELEAESSQAAPAPVAVPSLERAVLPVRSAPQSPAPARARALIPRGATGVLSGLAAGAAVLLPRPGSTGRGEGRGGPEPSS